MSRIPVSTPMSIGRIWPTDARRISDPHRTNATPRASRPGPAESLIRVKRIGPIIDPAQLSSGTEQHSGSLQDTCHVPHSSIVRLGPPLATMLIAMLIVVVSAHATSGARSTSTLRPNAHSSATGRSRRAPCTSRDAGNRLRKRCRPSLRTKKGAPSRPTPAIQGDTLLCHVTGRRATALSGFAGISGGFMNLCALVAEEGFEPPTHGL